MRTFILTAVCSAVALTAFDAGAKYVKTGGQGCYTNDVEEVHQPNGSDADNYETGISNASATWQNVRCAIRDDDWLRKKTVLAVKAVVRGSTYGAVNVWACMSYTSATGAGCGTAAVGTVSAGQQTLTLTGSKLDFWKTPYHQQLGYLEVALPPPSAASYLSPRSSLLQNYNLYDYVP